MLKISVAVVVALAGCWMDEPVEPSPEPIGLRWVPTDPGTEGQGTHLLGEKLDLQPSPVANEMYSLQGASRNGNAATFKTDINGALIAAINGTPVDIRTLVFTDGATPALTYTVTEFFPRTLDPELPARYTVLDSTGAKVCADYATLTTGSYSTTRAHMDTGRITIACEDGVVTKCRKWRYIPDDDSTSDKWWYHAACTRMANADECGDGTDHTREGTYIWMYDTDGIRADPPNPIDQVLLKKGVWPPPRNQFFYEALWDESGARCLSKSRWASKPMGTSCGNLVDPRTDSSGVFCDDIAGELTTGTRKLGSLSMFNDLLMSTWQNPNGDLVTTMRGYPSNFKSSRVYPFGNSNLQFVNPVPGTTGTTILREPTEEWLSEKFPPNSFMAAYMYCVKSGGVWTTRCAVSTSAPTGMTQFTTEPEGWMFAADPGGDTEVEPMGLWGGTLPSGATDYVGGADRPNGYIQVGSTLGYLLTVED